MHKTLNKHVNVIYLYAYNTLVDVERCIASFFFVKIHLDLFRSDVLNVFRNEKYSFDLKKKVLSKF